MNLATNIGRDLGVLFGDMSIVVIVLTVIGLALIAVEFFQPMWGLGVGCGSALTVVAVIIRMFADGTENMLFFYLFLIAVIISLAHVAMLYLHKREWLLQARFGDEPDVDDESALLNLEGVATTRIDGYGHMTVGEVNFYVTSDEPIAKGERVRVVKVEGDKIIVSKADEIGLKA